MAMNGHSGINTNEATQHLKTILNVGKNESEPAPAKVNSPAMSKSEDSEGNLPVGEITFQTINLSPDKDGSNVSIYGNDVSIFSSPMEYEKKCSQVIIDNMVDYGWEEKYYPGRLVTIHQSGKYLAYVLRRSTNQPGGYIRILKTKSDVRHLIKDYKCDVKDVSFAHSLTQLLLGSVDGRGEIFIHKIIDGDKLLSQLLIHVTRPAATKLSDYHRIIWCPYIPDDGELPDDHEIGQEDATSLVVVTHDEKAEIWNIDTLLKRHGIGEITTNEVTEGLKYITEFKKPITAATFAPDGTALALASLDGDVKFFQVGILNKNISPSCLHQWKPHKGKPLDSLFFLDNHKNHKPEVQFWRFAITGADDNSELKLWSCESWTCLQIIRIHPSAGDCVKPCLKAELDLSSKYFFLSDIRRKVVYILLLHQDPLTSKAVICCVSEFSVPYPVLSLAVASVNGNKSLMAMKSSDDEDDDEVNLNEDAEDQELVFDETKPGYLVKLFWIHTRSLQSCRIVYKPKITSSIHSVDSISNLSQESLGNFYKDALSDISIDIQDSRTGNDIELNLEKDMCVNDGLTSQSQTCSTVPLTSIPSHLSSYSGDVLLTPEDFTSPSHSNLPPTGGQTSLTHHDSILGDPTVCLAEGIDSLPVEVNGMIRRKSSQHSATSSPSREVAEILAPNQSDKISNISESNLNVEVESLQNNLNTFTKPVSQLNPRKQPDYHLSEWPQAPDPSKEYRTATSDTRSTGSVGDAPSIAFDASAHTVLLKLGHSLDDLAVKVTSLTDVLREQRRDIQNVQDDVRVLRQDQKHIHNNLHSLNSLENVLTKKLEQTLTQRLVPEYTKLEGIVTKRDKEDQQRLEQQIMALSQSCSASFDNRFEKTMKHEVKNSILPQISSVFDSLIRQLQSDIMLKLSNIDTSVKDNLSKHIKGKPFSDALIQSLTHSLQQQIQISCKEIFQTNVVPAFEKCCEQLFQQLSEIFKAGALDYIKYLDKHSQMVSSNVDGSVSNLKDEMRKLSSNMKTFASEKNAFRDDLNKLFLGQQEHLVSSIRQVVQEEMLKMAHEQNVQAMNSRAVTPVPQANPQVQKTHLLQLVKQGQINEAFQQALSAMDVQLVIFLCESVSVDQVFGPTPCPLKQHVLLSLLSQLSADLCSKTDIKVRYIEDVIASLDSSNPVTQEHIQNVLLNLRQKISAFCQKNPSHKLCRNLKRISMAIQSLI